MVGEPGSCSIGSTLDSFQKIGETGYRNAELSVNNHALPITPAVVVPTA